MIGQNETMDLIDQIAEKRMSLKLEYKLDSSYPGLGAGGPTGRGGAGQPGCGPGCIISLSSLFSLLSWRPVSSQSSL